MFADLRRPTRRPGFAAGQILVDLRKEGGCKGRSVGGPSSREETTHKRRWEHRLTTGVVSCGTEDFPDGAYAHWLGSSDLGKRPSDGKLLRSARDAQWQTH